MQKYTPSAFEEKWRKKWEKDCGSTYDFSSPKKKYYALVELPYTSGDLHIGHWFAFVTPDVFARFKQMNGYNVFFPMGFDAFGLPAENAAIKRGVHPRDWTNANIETMTRQFKLMGTTLLWDHLIVTCDSSFYRWNQWIFLKMYERGLVYRGKMMSNWCPHDKTVLANENIEDGKCWRCGSLVIQKEVEQWFIRITDFADRLLWHDNSPLDWPVSVRTGQNNWIGKKEGIEITFPLTSVNAPEKEIAVFTTRPDTLFGVTYIAVSPEKAQNWLKSGWKTAPEIVSYITSSLQKRKEKENGDQSDKSGIKTAISATHPITGEALPLFIADYVLPDIGVGAIMGVPGHDMRDFLFAKKFSIPITRVVVGQDGDMSEIVNSNQVQEEEGIMTNSDFLNGIDIHKATTVMMDYCEKKGLGTKKTYFHLHDWSISRQRYWGTPVPMIHCEKCGTVPVAENDLPVELPYDIDFTPRGGAPLASNQKWVNVICPKCGGEARRDSETLDTFFDSSWYFYRYLSPHFQHGPFDTDIVKKMLPADVYFGGGEHTLGHTLYARFFTKFFKDINLVSFDEFALKRVQHGIVLGPDGNKMSKSKGNVINPDEKVSRYGSDTVRLYMCFMMPYSATNPWSDETIAGVHRFLKRVWNIYYRLDYKKKDVVEDSAIISKLQKTIQNVTADIEKIKLNTAIAFMMDFLNNWEKAENLTALPQQHASDFLKLLAPFAPHMAEEIWASVFGESSSIHMSSWPTVNKKLLIENTITIPVQVNGKVRDIIIVSTDALNEKSVVEKALLSDKITKYVTSSKYRVIYREGKILNFILA